MPQLIEWLNLAYRMELDPLMITLSVFAYLSRQPFFLSELTLKLCQNDCSFVKAPILLFSLLHVIFSLPEMAFFLFIYLRNLNIQLKYNFPWMVLGTSFAKLSTCPPVFPYHFVLNSSIYYIIQETYFHDSEFLNDRDYALFLFFWLSLS